MTPTTTAAPRYTLSRPMLALSASALLLVTACTEAQMNDGRQNTRTGALGGAVTGAIAGAAISGGTRQGTLLGAAVGGIAGAAYGDYLDRQEAALRGQLGNNVQIVNTGDRLIVTMPQDILFATDSAQLSGALTGDLATVARSLNEYPATTVQVIGHTDNTGEAAYNQRLSAQRANAVASVLVNNGVNSGRIQSFGRGEDQPRATNLTPEGRQQNRRVEIVILPNA